MITPGATALTRTPRDASSVASERVRAASPTFGEGRQRGGCLTVGVVDEAGGDVDDVTAPLGDHLADGALGDVEEPGQVDGSDRCIVLECVFREGLSDEYPCIVDQVVDPSEPVEG